MIYLRASRATHNCWEWILICWGWKQCFVHDSSIFLISNSLCGESIPSDSQGLLPVLCSEVDWGPYGSWGWNLSFLYVKCVPWLLNDISRLLREIFKIVRYWILIGFILPNTKDFFSIFPPGLPRVISFFFPFKFFFIFK